MTDAWTGQDIDGRYVVDSVLGRGGMGIVLRARHRFTGAEVALKMLHTELSGDAAMQERFLTECRAAAAINHPAIVQVLDAGKTPEGELYLAMELLEGRSLRTALLAGDRPDPDAVRRIGAALLDALAVAHARGFVHRDLKPENVFLAGPAATVKLLDFGVAKSLTGTSSYTSAGIVLGTVSYMAPEQLADASSVDGRADLWAVGVMLYELLSGVLPYRATNLGELMSALTLSEPVPIQVHLPGVDASVRAFFARALARDRAQRFATAQEMARALAAARLETAAPPPQTMGGLPVTASGVTGARRIPAPDRSIPTTPSPAPPPPRPAPQRRLALSPQPPPPVVRPLAPGRPSRPLAATEPEGRWLAASIAAVAVVAIIMGVIAVATSGGAHHVAASARAPDRPSALAIGPEIGPAIDPAAGSAVTPTAPGSREVTSPRAPALPQRSPKQAAPRTSKSAAADDEARTPAALCEAVCRSGCAPEGPDCARICLADSRAVRCLKTIGASDCSAWSRCVLGASCSNAPPRGAASCRDTFACERECRDNISCSCSCLGRMAPAHAPAMTRLSMCALFMCANDAACVQARCEAPLATCMAR